MSGCPSCNFAKQYYCMPIDMDWKCPVCDKTLTMPNAFRWERINPRKRICRNCEKYYKYKARTGGRCFPVLLYFYLPADMKFRLYNQTCESFNIKINSGGKLWIYSRK